MEIWFSNPTYLWLLAPIPLFAGIIFLFLTREKKDIEQVISFHALELIFKCNNFALEYIKKNLMVFMFRALIYSTMVLVLAGTTIYYSGAAKEPAVVIAIDASGSMLADDIIPTRLEAVKETISVFLEEIPPNSRIGVISFSGDAYIGQGLSGNSTAESINNIQISHIPGTAIGTALKTAANLLGKEKSPKLVVLISDGGENTQQDHEIGKIISSINKEHITIDVIGIGRTEGSKLPGTELPSALNEPLLGRIAGETNGIYARAETKKSLIESYEKLISDTKFKIPIRLSVMLVILSTLLILADYIFMKPE